MNDAGLTVMIIVEGETEEQFVNTVLSPYLAEKHLWAQATQVTKPGQKGGDVRFDRVKRDVRNHLRQRPDTLVCTFVDYYGLKQWPKLDAIPQGSTPAQIAAILNGAAREEIDRDFAQQNANIRYIPFIAVHEFETLL